MNSRLVQFLVTFASVEALLWPLFGLDFGPDGLIAPLHDPWRLTERIATWWGAPLAGAWAGAVLITGRRAVRVLDQRAPQGEWAWVVGAAAALACSTANGAAMAHIENLLNYHDLSAPVVTGVLSLSVVATSLLLMPASRRGCCVACGYDHRGLSAGGRCPECGSAGGAAP